jgi:hypothetical protein
MVCNLGRAAFKAKGNAAAIQDLIFWAKKLQALEEKHKRNF